MKKMLYLKLFLILVGSTYLFNGYSKPYEYVPSDWKQARKSSKIVILPEKLLRDYDPVTIFFPDSPGPDKNAPEDNPQKIINMTYHHPGEFRWLDAKTLQFRPAEPWPVLKKFFWTVKNVKHEFFTILNPPNATNPYPGSKNLESIREITIRFKQKLEIEDLKRIIRIEVRPLPGLNNKKSVWLEQKDFEIKQMQRNKIKDNYNYTIILNKKIESGFKVLLHLRISLRDNLKDSMVTYEYSTREAFRLLGMGIPYGTMYPVGLGGSEYSAEQAINGQSYYEISLRFSEKPQEIPFSKIKQLVQFSPTVGNLSYYIYDKDIRIKGKFKQEQVYKAVINPVKIKDRNGRGLQIKSTSKFYFFFPKFRSQISWLPTNGIMERQGPQELPLKGRAVEKLDIRIYKIDPLNKNMWPFQRNFIDVDESKRPPGPGEEPKDNNDSTSYISRSQIMQHIRMLGSPAVSKIIDLPNEMKNREFTFGLDIKPYLEKISGKNQPGTYVIGFRDVKGFKSRKYVRIQVTDLCLTTVEERNGMTFFLTSYRTSLPVSGASFVIEGIDRAKNYGGVQKWEELIKGTTDHSGMFSYKRTKTTRYDFKRVIIRKDEDRLVFTPVTPYPAFRDNYWQNRSGSSWLSKLTGTPYSYKYEKHTKAFLYTERPIYKPEEPVHIKAYVRDTYQGELSHAEFAYYYFEVRGPGNKKWKFDTQLNEHGACHMKFDEEKLPTGYYYVNLYRYMHKGQSPYSIAQTTFKKEAYRVPKFEVLLHAPAKVGLDKEFSVSLAARYYAGGKVVGQKVFWRVNQFPYTYVPQHCPGFMFSSERTYSPSTRFQSSGSIEKQDTTDSTGSARIKIDPTLETDSNPRRYVVEATITGADDQTVTATKSIVALPSFVLGLKVERFIKMGLKIQPEIIALDVKEEFMPDLTVTVKLLKREWHSHLREAPLSSGKAEYITETVDLPVYEKEVKTIATNLYLDLDVDEAGIYILELEARDKMGRLQMISVDIYVGGDTPISWEKPKDLVFKAVPDKGSKPYKPGEKASILLQSPFQQAKVLAIVEKPEMNDFYWLDVNNGTGVFELNVENRFNPRIPVTFILMRPRVFDKQNNESKKDLGKPKTLAATTWINVDPIDYQMSIKLTHPKSSMPGKEIEMEIELKDPDNEPINGEVALWLVDKAVLALAKERSIDPLPFFIQGVNSRILVKDFRNIVIGKIEEMDFVGGDGRGKKMAEMSARMRKSKDLLDKATVRKQFRTVAFYDPSILIDGSGKKKIKIQLPDNLTDFAIRAVACSGQARFGSQKSVIAIRLPLIVQPAIPRFVRYGDQIFAGGIGRVVEGEGGPGNVSIKINGGQLNKKSLLHVTWEKDIPQQFYFPIKIDSPVYNKDGDLQNKFFRIKMAVSRLSDEATDAFEIQVPIKEDRNKIYEQKFVILEKGKAVEFPEMTYTPRQGTIQQKLLLTHQGALLKMVAGLNYLVQYPHGCLEQKLSQSYGVIALRGIYKQYGIEDIAPDAEKIFNDTLDTIKRCRQPGGFYGYWPGSRSFVYLTAYVLDYLVEAEQAGFKFDRSLKTGAIQALKKALRFDYSNFVDGFKFYERVAALHALSKAGYFDSSYVEELGGKAKFYGLESEAKFLLTLMQNNYYNKNLIKGLKGDLWKQIIFKLHGGKEIYNGIQYRTKSWGGWINSHEIKTFASMLRTLSYKTEHKGRVQMLINELVLLGRKDGWGNTSANSASLLALMEIVQNPSKNNPLDEIQVKFPGQEKTLKVGKDKVANYWQGAEKDNGSIKLLTQTKKKVFAGLSLSYMPQEPGDEVKARNDGFVVEREIILVSKSNLPDTRILIDKPKQALDLKIGDIIEDHVRIINPDDRPFVAIACPIAAGVEPMNPNLLTSPPEAKTKGNITLRPDYAMFLDDQVCFYYDYLPKGTYDFYFRVKATTEGSYVQPAAYAEMMYQQGTKGNSPGLRLFIKR